MLRRGERIDEFRWRSTHPTRYAKYWDQRMILSCEAGMHRHSIPSPKNLPALTQSSQFG